MIKTILKTLMPVGLGLLLYMIVFAIWHPYIVSGSSMEPTLYGNDLVLCYPSYEDSMLDRGDIVICKVGHKSLIKRIVAVPGDTLLITDGILYVNGEESPYNYQEIVDAGELSEEITLSDGEYYCLGDNRNNSLDSRQYGAFTTTDITYLVSKVINFKGVVYEY